MQLGFPIVLDHLLSKLIIILVVWQAKKHLYNMLCTMHDIKHNRNVIDYIFAGLQDDFSQKFKNPQYFLFQKTNQHSVVQK